MGFPLRNGSKNPGIILHCTVYEERCLRCVDLSPPGYPPPPPMPPQALTIGWDTIREGESPINEKY